MDFQSPPSHPGVLLGGLRLLRIHMTTRPALIDELELAITQGSADRCAKIALGVTDLFVRDSNKFSDDEINFFDSVISRLAREIESSVRALLADRLAPIENAPLNITRLLASDNEIRVAAPILQVSKRLSESDLAKIIQTMSQEHLFAISQRKSLSENVTELLVERGNHRVVLNTVNNAGAKFSKLGFSLLVNRSNGNDELAVCVGSRPDIPHRLYMTLLEVASERVRTKLIAENPRAKPEIDHAVGKVADALGEEARSKSSDFDPVDASVRRLYAGGRLNEIAIQESLEQGKIADIVAALSTICKVPIEVIDEAMTQGKSETLLVLAKAARLSWETTKRLLSYRAGPGGRPDKVNHNLATFERLNFETAHRIMEFYRMRRTQPSLNSKLQVPKSDAERTMAVEHYVPLKIKQP